jgi:hypothetical protein
VSYADYVHEGSADCSNGRFRISGQCRFLPDGEPKEPFEATQHIATGRLLMAPILASTTLRGKKRCGSSLRITASLIRLQLSLLELSAVGALFPVASRFRAASRRSADCPKELAAA